MLCSELSARGGEQGASCPPVCFQGDGFDGGEASTGLHKGKKSHPADGIAAFLSSARSNLAHRFRRKMLSCQVNRKSPTESDEIDRHSSAAAGFYCCRKEA